MEILWSNKPPNTGPAPMQVAFTKLEGSSGAACDLQLIWATRGPHFQLTMLSLLGP
jgi:hypothetical protein